MFTKYKRSRGSYFLTTLLYPGYVNDLVPKGNKLPGAFETTSVYDPTWGNLSLNWGILFLHGVVYLLITLNLQKRKDIF